MSLEFVIPALTSVALLHVCPHSVTVPPDDRQWLSPFGARMLPSHQCFEEAQSFTQQYYCTCPRSQARPIGCHVPALALTKACRGSASKVSLQE